MPKEYKIVEKKNHLHCHALFGQNKEGAEEFLKNTVPVYVAKRYYMDKTLKPDDFEVIYN